MPLACSHVAKPIEPDELWRALLKWVKPKTSVSAAKVGTATGAAASADDVGEIPTIAGLNTMLGLKRTLGKKALYLSLMRKFMTAQAEAPVQISGALDGDDWKTAELAAQRRTDEQLFLMRTALDSIDNGISVGDSSIEADFHFHLQIALATGNKYFEDFYRHLGTTTIPRARLDTSKFSPEPTQNYLQQANREHEYMLDAIARKDAESARAGMRLHLTNSRERLRRASEASDQHAFMSREVAVVEPSTI